MSAGRRPDNPVSVYLRRGDRPGQSVHHHRRGRLERHHPCRLQHHPRPVHRRRAGQHRHGRDDGCVDHQRRPDPGPPERRRYAVTQTWMTGTGKAASGPPFSSSFSLLRYWPGEALPVYGRLPAPGRLLHGGVYAMEASSRSSFRLSVLSAACRVWGPRRRPRLLFGLRLGLAAARPEHRPRVRPARRRGLRRIRRGSGALEALASAGPFGARLRGNRTRPLPAHGDGELEAARHVRQPDVPVGVSRGDVPVFRFPPHRGAEEAGMGAGRVGRRDRFPSLGGPVPHRVARRRRRSGAGRDDAGRRPLRRATRGKGVPADPSAPSVPGLEFRIPVFPPGCPQLRETGLLAFRAAHLRFEPLRRGAGGLQVPLVHDAGAVHRRVPSLREISRDPPQRIPGGAHGAGLSRFHPLLRRAASPCGTRHADGGACRKNGVGSRRLPWPASCFRV